MERECVRGYNFSICCGALTSASGERNGALTVLSDTLVLWGTHGSPPTNLDNRYNSRIFKQGHLSEAHIGFG